MKLYLVQHADALTEEQDPERPLSKKGMADATRMASFLKFSGVEVEEVVHSGKLRAHQTADILAEAVLTRGVCDAMQGLGPNDPTDTLFNAADIAAGDLMAVGHMPYMGRMVARVLTGFEGGAQVGFQPGTVACLERAGKDWVLEWIIRPDLLSHN